MTSTYLLAFAASFLFIALKAFQQLNVVHEEYMLLVPTSMLMAFCEVYVIYNAAKYGMGYIVFWVGLGSGLGALFAVYVHKIMRKNRG